MSTLAKSEVLGISVHQFPRYGIAGVLIIILSEVLLFADVKIIGIYFTPLVWTGYILFIDALNYRLSVAYAPKLQRRSGTSLLCSRRLEFLLILPWSIVCWLIFEAYNLHLRNWSYIGLPENVILRYFGYLWSFATIFPAILETAELFQNIFSYRQRSSFKISQGFLIALSIIGACCLIFPLLASGESALKLFGLVWIGFFLLLDPMNYFMKGKSVLREMERGDYSLFTSLVLSGVVCGILWEFWNYWAEAKWHYSVPLSFAGPKIFEMPLVGYLGFVPFALECYAMQQFLITMISRLFQRSPQ
ncbi:MAG: hypothetical protein HY707_10120 [Ignavibacteriae bacterium]|nr:hypothetical protein [Ignavibacteriota bacterium]